MCLIVHRELHNGRGSNLPNSVIDFNARINPDGFGLAWREHNGVLRSTKFGPDEEKDFRVLLKEIDRDSTVEYVAHWRRATHGPPCTRLSHPFSYSDKKDREVLVFHNGIIPIGTPKDESDTSVFVNEVLRNLSPRWWANNALKYLVEETVGASRILVMTEDETVKLNTRLWDKEGGIWYSTWPFPSPQTRTGGWTSWAPSPGKGGTTTPTGSPGVSVTTTPSGPIVIDGSAKGTSCPPASVTRQDIDVQVTVPDWQVSSVDERWVHGGHVVTPLGKSSEDDEGDLYGTAICEQCSTIGDYYIIQNQVYIDVAHVFVDADADEDEEEDMVRQYAMRDAVASDDEERAPVRALALL